MHAAHGDGRGFWLQLSALANLRSQGLSNLVCMVRNCRQEVLDCVTDPSCKAGLDCLQACGPTDQVHSFPSCATVALQERKIHQEGPNKEHEKHVD